MAQIIGFVPIKHLREGIFYTETPIQVWIRTDRQTTEETGISVPGSPSLNPRRPKAGTKSCGVLKGFFGFSDSCARWKDIPERFPSGNTCRWRLHEWQEADLLADNWQYPLTALDAKGRLRWEEVFTDGTFSSAKKGGKVSARRNVGRKQGLWWWQMVGGHLSGLSLLAQRPMSLR
jgi:hypothetical protein